MACSVCSSLKVVVVIALNFLWAFIRSCLPSFLSAHRRGAANHKPRIAIIGGGIAGTTAAWAANKSNAFRHVTLFEPREVLGGNAKTFDWDTSGNGNATVRTGLSVLAWPPAYFRHYELLLRNLGLPTVDVVPKFYVSEDGERPTFRQGHVHPEWAKDQQGWDKAVVFVRRVNRFCFWVDPCRRVAAVASMLRGPTYTPPSPPSNNNVSMYEVTWWNPLNVIPARWVTHRLFHVSDGFWEKVVVPVYSSSFLTARLDGLPAVILPPLDDIISIGAKDPLKTLHTWNGSSKDVFDKMAEVLPESDVLTGCNVLSVQKDETTGDFVVAYEATSEVAQYRLRQRCGDATRSLERVSTDSDTFLERFDIVIFACPATAVDKLSSSTNPQQKNALRDTLFEAIIPHIRYENERDSNFVTGTVHSDVKTAIPSDAMREELLREKFTNYIELHRRSTDATTEPTLDLENTFVLGTWVPQAVQAAQAKSTNSNPSANKKSKSTNSKKVNHPSVDASSLWNSEHNLFNMMVTYNARGDERRRALQNEQRLLVDNSWAHPQFTKKSLALSMCLPLIQGRHQAYYCASYTTPGNGHDLSLLSALVVVDAAVSAATDGRRGYYPFTKTEAFADFTLLKKMMMF